MGKCAPSVETLQKLCDVLQTEPWEFYKFNTVSDEKMLKDINEKIKNNNRLLKIIYNLIKSVD